MKKTQNFIERQLKKHALHKGVYIKVIDMPVTKFIEMVQSQVGTFKGMEEMVFFALEHCEVIYEDTLNVKCMHMEDSNMPGLTENKFDEFTAVLFCQIISENNISDQEKSRLIFNLSLMIENLAEDQSYSVAK